MIENSSKTIKLGEWDFNIIQLEDIEIYNEFIRKTRCPANLWSSNFAYMWALSQSRKKTLLWKIIHGLLVTFAISYKNTLYIFCVPYGDAEPEKLIDVLFYALNYCDNWNGGDRKKSVVKMVNEEQLAFLSNSPRFNEYFTKRTWVGIERHFDIDKVCALKGREFENVRNRVNKFYRENPDAKIHLYREDDFDELIELGNQWKITFGKKYEDIYDGVYYKELIKNSKALNQTTIVMKKNDRIIGMASGGILPTKQAWGSVIKYDSNYTGLSETMVVEFAKLIRSMSPESKYLNVGSDLGPGGLRNYKLKFRPELNFKRYRIHLK